MIAPKTLSALAICGVMSSCHPAVAFTCDDPLATKEQIAKCNDLEDFLRIDPKLFNLPIPKSLGTTLGDAWTNRPRCSDSVAPGTVIQTDPPTYNCGDLEVKTPEQQEIDSLRKRIEELERHVKNLRLARIKGAGKCSLID